MYVMNDLLNGSCNLKEAKEEFDVSGKICLMDDDVSLNTIVSFQST